MTSLQNSSSLNFNQLVDVIQETHQTLFVRATKAVNVSLTLRNWFIGFYISKFQLQGADRAKYGDRLLADLSTLLQQKNVPSTGQRQLYNYLSFFQCYPEILRLVTAKSSLDPEILIQMTDGDQPPIGILLCTHKNHELVEYALAEVWISHVNLVAFLAK